MTKIQFDEKGGTALIRAAFFQRLKQDKTWNSFMMGRDNLGDYIEYAGKPA
jgi:hypothetical protein